jgi:tetratricopeptide (TPR) repeat protein
MEQERSRQTVAPQRRSARVIAAILIGIGSLTAWNLARSQALEHAQRAFARGDLTVALGHALGHLGRRPWSREAALLAARCLSRLDFAGEAEPYYVRAGQLTLSDLQVRAYGLVRSPHPERAVTAYNEILARSPENVTALRRLAAVELALNDTSELLKLAQRLSQIPSGAVIGTTLRGVIHHNEKNRQDAVAAFEHVVELDPELREMPLSHRVFWGYLADDLIGIGRIDQARRHLTRVLEKESDPELMNTLGHTYFLQGELDDAERCFLKAVEWDQSYYAPYMNLAKLALQRRNHQVALHHLDQARVLAPRQHSVLYNLIAVYRQLGRTDEAERVQEMVNQLREQSGSSPGSTRRPWPHYAL